MIVEIIFDIIKLLFVIGLGLSIVPLILWVERRASALMQRRRGPNRVGIFNYRLWGLGQALADAVKLAFKQEIVPRGVDKSFFHLAPIFAVIPVFLVLATITFGPSFDVFGKEIRLSLINLDIGFLFIIVISTFGVYGAAISGWASNNKYSLLGALRASAQMISYEIPLGLSLIPIVLIYNSLDLNEIASQQNNFFYWGMFLSPLSLVLFLISMFAETNRTPFDLAEGESEIVAGFHTEYGSTKFATFFLAEYIAMFGLSCLITSLFFGAWHIPFISYEMLINIFGNQYFVSLIGVFVFLIKAFFFMFLYVWVRWTLPRYRYDQLMNLGWRFMLPLGLFNIFITSIVIALIRFN